MNVWPATLQQCFNEGGFNFTPGDTTVSTEMDFGARKVRQRYTVAVDQVSGSIDLKKDQYDTLMTFYRTTSAGGSLPFEWIHPITLATTVYRFMSPPKISRLGGEYFGVNLSLEIVG